MKKNLIILSMLMILIVIGGGLVSAVESIYEITQTGLADSYEVRDLVVVSDDQSTTNTNVESAIEGITPIDVTLATLSLGDSGYDFVRINPINAGSNIQLWAKDTEDNWYDINLVGWGPLSGFPLPANYNVTTPVYLISDQDNIYTLNVELVDVNNNNEIITSSSEDVYVDGEGPSITEVYIEPTYPNLDSTSVNVYATITDQGSGVDYATLYYRIGDEEVQSTTFTGPFSGGYAGIVNGNPKDNVLVEYHIKAVDNVENYVWYPGPLTWESFIYDGSSPTTTLTIGEPKYEGSMYITSNTQITLECSDAISGCKEIHYSIDGGSEEIISGDTTSFTIKGEDKSYTITYYSVDNAGNVETEKSQSVILDNTKPETTDDSDLYVDWQANDVTVTLTPTDSGSGIFSTEYCVGNIDCTPNQTGISVSVTCAGDSVCEQYVRYFSTDNVGNVEDIKTSDVVMIDKEKSMTTLTIGSPKYNDKYITSSTEITLTCDDGTGSECDKIYYQIDVGGFLEYINPLTISGNDGDYILQYYSVDKVENIETTNEKTLVLDNTEPTTTDSAESTWTNLDVTVTLDSLDSLGSGVASTKYCVYDKGDEVCIDYQTGISVSVTCAGDSVCEQYVRYFSTDNVGNVEDIKTSNVVMIDKTGPVTTVELPIQGSWFSTDFVMVFSDTDLGVGTLGTCYYSINDGNFIERANCNSSVIITVGEGGDCNEEGEDTCKIEAYAVDSLGNIGNTVEVIYSIDWTWPTEIVSSSPSGEVTEDNTILGIETNKWATCKYDTQSKSYEDMANNMTSSVDGINHEAGLTNLEDGMYVYYVRCQDNIGNKMRTSETIVFTVDTSGNYNLVIDLNSGWEFFFLPRIILETITSLNGNYSVQNVLSSIEGNYIGIMYHYDTGTGWASYVPDRETNEGWPLNDLTEFDDTTNSPYWIQMIQSDRLELE